MSPSLTLRLEHGPSITGCITNPGLAALTNSKERLTIYTNTACDNK